MIDFFKARTNSEFDIAESYRSYVINDAWRSNTALWNLISAFAGDASSKLYERIVDMTKNISDIDICDVRQLESLSYQLGLKSGFGFIDSLPSEIYDLMNVLSIKQNYFFNKNRIFTESGIDSIIDNIPNSIDEITNNNSGDVSTAIKSIVFDIAAQMVSEGRLTKAQRNACVSAVNDSGSVNTLEALIYDENASEIPETFISEHQFTAIRLAVLAGLVSSGKINYTDYKSSKVQSNSFQDVFNVNVKPAIEFKEILSNGHIEHDYKVNHSIRVGTSQELSTFLNTEQGQKFNASIWKISKTKFLSFVNESDSISDKSKENIANISGNDVALILNGAINAELIKKQEFTVIVNLINSMSLYDVLQDIIDNGVGLEQLATNMKNSGIINQNGTANDFKIYVNEKGLRRAIEIMLSLSKLNVDKFGDRSISWLYQNITYLGTFNSIIISSTEAKIPNGVDAVAVFNDGTWVLFRNMWSRFPGMELSENKDVEAGRYVQFNKGAVTLQLPATNLENWKSEVGISVSFTSIPTYVGFQVFLNNIIYKSYFNLLKEKLNCVLNAGNESDLSLYESDFMKYTNEVGFRQYINDKNVNFGFYRALVLSNFCSNICSNRNLVGDWFLDSTLHQVSDANRIDVDEVLDDVCRTLCDMTLAVTVRREILKKLAIQYSKIGSNAGVEKVVGDFVLRNFTKRADDWNMSSNTAVLNDSILPTLDSIRKKFSAEITEYYDNTEYLNISADSAKRMEFDGTGTIAYISSNIGPSGNLVTGLTYKNIKHYSETNEPIVSGGNERFWTTTDYRIRVTDQAKDIIDFYENVDGVSDSLTSINNISAFVTTLWENCSLSALSAENEEMHRKYVGDNTGYSRAVNVGNPNYPTIAPIASIANLTEIYGSMERDYQSVLNDDRPATVEGVAVAIISAFSCVPVKEDDVDIGTPREIIGIPPFFTYPAEEYVREVTHSEPREGIKHEERYNTIGNQTSSIKWENITEIRKTSSQVSSIQVSTWTEPVYTNTSSYVPKLMGVAIVYNENRIYNSYLGDYDDIEYSLSGIVSANGPSMRMTQVALIYDSTSAAKFNEVVRMNGMNQIYDAYLIDEDLSGINEITGLSAEFPTIRSNISNIKVDYYNENLVNERIVQAYVNNPIATVQTYTYNSNDNAISSYKDSTSSWEISSYGDVASYIMSSTNLIKPKISNVSDRNAFFDYSDAVVNGKILDTAEDYLVKYMYWIRNSMDRLSYFDQVASLRSTINSKFDQVTAYSTSANYTRYKTMIDAEISAATAWSRDISAYNTAKYSETEIDNSVATPISSFSDSVVNSLFGDYVSSVVKMLNMINLDVETVVNTDTTYRDVSANIIIWTTVWNDTPYTYQVSSVAWDWEYTTETYYVDVPYTYYVDVTSQVTAYKIVDSETLAYTESETPQMFDIHGGLINSWRNVNVELRGYQACYEASPNLNRNYVEQKYIDVDGPWIGEALYDLIYQLIPLSGASIQDNIITPDPIPENINVSQLRKEHYYDVKLGVKETKWWLTEYIDKLQGHDIMKQLPFYVSDIIGCRNKSIFEVEVDSFNNQYTLYKDKPSNTVSKYDYDREGVLWMRHNGFPFSFPIMEKPPKGWENSSSSDVPTITNKIGTYERCLEEDYNDPSYGQLFAWENESLNPAIMYTQSEHPKMYDISIRKNYQPEVESVIVDMDMKTSQESLGNNIDQIYLGYTMNYYRSIFNRCLAFGVNSTSLWAAGYDGKNSDGSDHFNIRIVQLKYFEIDGIRYYGTRNPRTMNKFNSDPTGYDSNNIVDSTINDEYKWLDFCGGYYDGNVINFVFYGKSGFRFRVYNLINARLNNADIIAEFNSDIDIAEEYKPFISGENSVVLSDRHNPFRLVEDNDYCYIGWVTKSGGKKRVVVCQNDKKNYTFQSILAWNIPDYDESDELESLVAGTNMVKVRLKTGVKYGSGHIYYGRMSEPGFVSNEGYEDLYPAENMKMNYVVDDSEENIKTKLPSIPIIGLTQWRHWGYSLTQNSLMTISYADAVNVLAETSAAVSPSGVHYDVMDKKTYLPGNCMKQSVIAYDPYSGVDDSTGVQILTGYEIGLEINEITPHLQSVIPAYAPVEMSAEIIPSVSDYEMSLIANSTPMMLSSYYGLPYNNIYAERTDLERNAISQTDLLQPNSEYNFLVLKNFYNYAYEHEYNWNNAVLPYDNSSLDKIVGWRKYKKCSISRYSDSMWLSYNYLRDYTVLLQSNKQQSVAYVMNDYEFVEVVYGTIQLMNTNYSKSNVFSISINNSTLNMQGYADGSSEAMEKRENVKKQIKEEIRNMIDDYAPAQTQLWKIEFNDEKDRIYGTGKDKNMKVYIGTIDNGEVYSTSQIDEDTRINSHDDTTVKDTVPQYINPISNQLIKEIDVNAGSVIYAFIPKGYVAYKDNGFGIMVPFRTETTNVNGTIITGSNGNASGENIINIKNTEYNVYGEFSIVSGKIKIYVMKG